MRKTTWAVTVFVLVAGALAIGISQGDAIKAWLASAGTHQSRDIATATVSPVKSEEETSVSPTATEIGDEPAAAQSNAPDDTAVTEQSDAMTPADLSKAALNDQTPAAGNNDVPAADETKSETKKETVEVKTDYVVDVKKSLENRTLGSASAPLTVHDFSSLTCPHCAHFHNDILPVVKEKYIDTGKVRWVFHSFPLNEAALKADMLARCAPDDQYLKLADFMYKNQERWAFDNAALANLNMLLKIAGITDDIFTACTNSTELEVGLVKAAQEATEKYKINSTPSFVFNDGDKIFSGAGTLEGFLYDLDRALENLEKPGAGKPKADMDKK